MAKRVDTAETTVPECPWRLGGACSRHAVERLREAADRILLAGGLAEEARPPTIAAMLDFLVKTVLAPGDRPCAVITRQAPVTPPGLGPLTGTASRTRLPLTEWM